VYTSEQSGGHVWEALVKVSVLCASVCLAARLAYGVTLSPSIVLNPGSPGNGVYWYDLAVPGASLTFNPGNLVTFTGMSGVTSAAAVEEVSFEFGANVSFTNTQAVFQALAADTFPNDQGAPYSYFEIDPPSSIAGTINWSIQTSTATFSGTVQGPIAAVTSIPEPTMPRLLGLGMIGFLATIIISNLRRPEPRSLPWKFREVR
jgi:hypothetical protein